MSKLGLGAHVISEGAKYRQIVEITELENGKRSSKTYQQEKHNGSWRLRVPQARS